MIKNNKINFYQDKLIYHEDEQKMGKSLLSIYQAHP
jgi:hypothetical protein